MKSLRSKVFLGVVAGLLLVTLAAEVVLYRQAISFAEKELLNSLKRYAIALTEVVYVDSNDQLHFNKSWEKNLKIGLNDRADFFEFKTLDSQFITDSHNLGGESLPEPGTDRGYKLVDYGRILLGVYEYHFNLSAQDRKHLTFKLLVANNTGLVKTARKSTMRTLLLFTPLILLAAFGVSFALTAIILASISKFRTRVVELEQTDTKSRLNLNDVDTEMKPLGQALNKFIDQINQQLLNESRLLAETAHELHTPLVNMHTEIRFLQKGNPTIKDYKYGLKEVERGVIALQRMTDNMLMLNRIESGKYHPGLSLLDLRDEIQRFLKKIKKELTEEGVSVRLQGDQVMVCCNRVVINLIIKQLIKNASMYAPGSPIDISWKRVEDKVSLHIDDNGQGIAKSERELIFNRLYRITDPNHSRPSGSGLGLSLVRLYAKSVNATVQCHESATGGARFTIALPTKCQTEDGL